MINHLSTQKNQQITLIPEPTSALPSWQAQINDAITDVDELLILLNLSSLKDTLYIPSHFRLKVPRSFVAKMKIGDRNDPLLRQILPDIKEQYKVPGFTSDPLAEQAHNPSTGLLHKYRSRVLLTLTGACAVHCRYCFRQHFDYSANLPKSDEMLTICQYISEHPEINEVILSGGDPLSLNNRRLFLWLDALESLPQIKTIRLHTRLPIVIPERLDSELLQRLQSSQCQIVAVVHVNHPNEIDDHTARYLLKLKQNNVIALNQTVLLAGINDDVSTLSKLSWRLLESGILPYYLHLLDRVAGSAHFMVSESCAIKLYWQLLTELPGYLVPKLVQELPNKPFKTPVNIFPMS